jgi:hypothetical protein
MITLKAAIIHSNETGTRNFCLNVLSTMIIKKEISPEAAAGTVVHKAGNVLEKRSRAA